MNEATTPTTTSNVVTEQDKGRCALAPGSRSLPIAPGKLTIDPSDPEVQWILGKTCLSCGPMAHVFQRAGYPIPRHAEDEQAHVLLWMLARYQEHGQEWRKKGDEELRALIQANKADDAAQLAA